MQEFFALNQMREALRSDKTSFDHKALFLKMIGGSSVAEQVFLVESSKILAGTNHRSVLMVSGKILLNKFLYHF